MTTKPYLGVLATASLVLLAACGTTATSTPSSSGKNWLSLGVSQNSNILHELDQTSVKKNGQVVTFRDKKTFTDISKEHFQYLPKHKYSLNTWEMNCANKTYRLVATQLIAENGTEVWQKTFDFNTAPTRKIVAGSSTDKQYQAVCR
ncbi:MAG: hypothetical protein KA214_03390 [Neisseriaceae bacterium]|nr:hypothetical protein [Neisseriaceae bacterium]